jgi:hypothetical protein
MEVKNMSSLIEDNEILREWMAEAGEKAKAEFLREMLQSKFGSLPTWADDLLARAAPSDVQRWGMRLVKAATIKDVFAGE